MAASHSIPPFPPEIDRDRFGDWLSGFTDGEGCFFLGYEKRAKIAWPLPRAFFQITLRLDDQAILETIQSFWQVGIIGAYPYVATAVNARPAIRYKVEKKSDLLNVLLPHFNRYPLRAKKLGDFLIWEQAVRLCCYVSDRRARPIGHGGKGGFHGGFAKWTKPEQAQFADFVKQLKEARNFDLSGKTCPLKQFVARPAPPDLFDNIG